MVLSKSHKIILELIKDDYQIDIFKKRMDCIGVLLIKEVDGKQLNAESMIHFCELESAKFDILANTLAHLKLHIQRRTMETDNDS